MPGVNFLMLNNPDGSNAWLNILYILLLYWIFSIDVNFVKRIVVYRTFQLVRIVRRDGSWSPSARHPNSGAHATNDDRQRVWCDDAPTTAWQIGGGWPGDRDGQQRRDEWRGSSHAHDGWAAVMAPAGSMPPASAQPLCPMQGVPIIPHQMNSYGMPSNQQIQLVAHPYLTSYVCFQPFYRQFLLLNGCLCISSETFCDDKFSN